MVSATYDQAMARVFADEGGYTNDPVDPGGATNWGITIIDARKYWKPNATADDVRNMPKSVASNIYRAHYANPMRYDQLPAGFDYSVLDAAINSGVGRAPVWGGRALGKETKDIDTVVSLANAYPDKVKAIQNYWAIRLAFLRGLKTFWRFGKGWTRRVTSGEAAAVKMWLTFGVGLPVTETKKRMDTEASAANTKASNSKKIATGAGTVGTAGGAATPTIDPAVLSMGGKIAIGCVVVCLIALALFMIQKAIVHRQRSEAYANA